MQEITVYAKKVTSRLNYVILFLEERLGVSIQCTSDVKSFASSSKPKLNYSDIDLNALSIQPHNLLFEKDVKAFDYSTLSSDPLALIFFLISRYEEYIINERDIHNRFQAKDSYLYSLDQLQHPIVDYEVAKLKKDLKNAYPQLVFKTDIYETQLTIDIDQAYAYKGKGLKRALGGLLRDAIQCNFAQVVRRKLTFVRLMPDPFDVYQWVKTSFSQYNNTPIFFFLVGDYATYDKNLHHQNPGFQKVVREVKNWATVGLHPSYASNQSLEVVKKEKRRLEKMIGEQIMHSRQHYIMLSLPQTYQRLITMGIQHDYSMGFADDIGFRAGTSRSFLWYDLLSENPTDLRIHPFCVMDVTLKNYLKLSVHEADQKVEILQQNIRKVEGEFTMICHNESLSDYHHWRGWRDMFVKWLS